MKMVFIEAVPKPKSFADVKFMEKDWTEADKRGPQKVPAITALEAIKNSKGLYRIKPDQEAVEKKLVSLTDPEDMTNEAIAMELTAHGKPPRKNMERKTAVKFLKELREKAAQFIIEDDE